MTDKTAADHADEIHAVITKTITPVCSDGNASTNKLVRDIVRNLSDAGFIIIPKTYVGFVDRAIERLNEALQVNAHVTHAAKGKSRT